MKSNVAERVKEQVGQLKGTYARGRESARELTHTAAASSRQVALRADDWVHDHSWKLLAVTLVAGLVLGFLLKDNDYQPRLERIPR